MSAMTSCTVGLAMSWVVEANSRLQIVSIMCFLQAGWRLRPVPLTDFVISSVPADEAGVGGHR